MYRVYIIAVDGKITVTEQEKAPELKQLQDAVGGYIETLPYFTKYDGMTRGRAYCNENGLALRLPINREAMLIWKDNVPNGSPRMMNIVGPVVYYAKVPAEKVGHKLAGLMLCAFTFIQCSDHYSLNSGTWDGKAPKTSYHGEARINGKAVKKHFRFGYASGIVGNDKAFIKVK